MLPVAAAICFALPQPTVAYTGELPALRTPRPRLPASASSAAGFAPPGWSLERAVEGDLNRDGRPDLVAILKGADPDCIVRIERAASPMDTNPRVVLVAFGGKAGFTLHLANVAVIPRVDDPYIDDPLNLDAFAIRDDVIRLGLKYWRSMGGWSSFNATLSFRWDGRQFRLIGFDRESLQRNSGRSETVSVNFVTGRARVATGSMEDDVDDVTRWERLPAQRRETLEAIGDGLAYEPKLAGRR